MIPLIIGFSQLSSARKQVRIEEEVVKDLVPDKRAIREEFECRPPHATAFIPVIYRDRFSTHHTFVFFNAAFAYAFTEMNKPRLINGGWEEL